MLFPAKIAATALVQTVAKSTIPALSGPTFWNGVASQCLSYGVACAIGKSFQGTEMLNNNNEKFAPFLTIRGGAAVPAPVFDLDRAGFRLYSIEQYCIVSSLLMGAAIGK